MAKMFNRSTVRVSTRCEEGVSYNVPSDDEYRVRSLGRGLWHVEREDGYCLVLRTAELQRFISGLSRRYVGDYWSSGEPQYFVSEVRVERDPWWRW